MERINVLSSNLASIGYELENKTLEIEFLNGGIYQYFNVPEKVYTGLMNADSHGKFLNDYVKKAGYHFEKIK